MRLALHQLNATVGDLAGNASAIRDGIAQAKEAGAQIVAFPELAITGYPPEDLLLKEHFLRDARAAVDGLAAEARGIVVLVGFPERADDVYNSMAVLADGAVQGIYRKMRLPNYGVFDEVRYFQAGTRPAIIEVDGATVGLTICEDDWVPDGPIVDEALAGAEVVVNLSASPYQAGKPAERETMLKQRARDNLVAFAFCAQVGGQDELVFDGGSVVIDHQGTVIGRAPQFAEHLLIADVDAHAARAARLRDTRPRTARFIEQRPAVAHLGTFTTGSAGRAARPAPEGKVHDLLDPDAEVYAALVLGTRDYV